MAGLASDKAKSPVSSRKLVFYFYFPVSLKMKYSYVYITFFYMITHYCFHRPDYTQNTTSSANSVALHVTFLQKAAISCFCTKDGY